MNYIELIKNFWLQHNAYSLTVTETALYFYLLETNNLCRWANTINRNNGKVLADLSIASLKTLSNARNRLKQVGLIDFKTKNGSPNVVYTLVKFTEVGAQVCAEVGAEVGAEIIKHKHKQKQVGNSGELFPPDQPPKKKPPKPKVEFIPPTAEEVREYFRDKLPDWELQADIFYNHFSGLGWKTATGAKVERWDSRANLWIIEKKQQDNGKTENQAQRQNNRDADKAAKARNLLDEYAAIEQGSNAISHQGEIPDL